MASIKRLPSDTAIADARLRGREEMRLRGARSVRYDRRSDEVVIALNTGVVVRVPRERIPGVETAEPRDLAKIVLSPLTTSFTIEMLDMDYSIPGLLRRVLGFNEQQRSAGARSTPAKRAAAVANGKRGGRPHKAIDR